MKTGGSVRVSSGRIGKSSERLARARVPAPALTCINLSARFSRTGAENNGQADAVRHVQCKVMQVQSRFRSPQSAERRLHVLFSYCFRTVSAGRISESLQLLPVSRSLLEVG